MRSSLSGKGSIPAWAGEPPTDQDPARSGQVYPRVGGGTAGNYPPPSRVGGLSPRGRGNRASAELGYVLGGSIPAWAGEPGVWPVGAQLAQVYPRVGGGTWCALRSRMEQSGLSPRGRGNRRHLLLAPGQGRSIPAWAGEPRRGRLFAGLSEVYPRVGGGTHWWNRLCLRMWGLSPRGRGNPDTSPHSLRIYRSIPAWAGEPASTTT